MVVGLVRRVEDARPGCFALPCLECKRFVEVRPPLVLAA